MELEGKRRRQRGKPGTGGSTVREMGLRDKIEKAAAGASAAAPQPAAAAPQPAAVSAGQRFEYDAEVNKKSLNMGAYAAKLNARARQGWRLHTAFEQDGNTVSIYERAVG